MANTTIRNIIFDLGGVILNIDYQRTAMAFKTLGIADFDQRYSQARQTTLFDDYETGKITESVFVERFNSLAGKRLPKVDVLAAWNAMLMDFPASRLHMLETLRPSYSLFLLSNTNTTHQNAFEGILKESYGHRSLDHWFEKVYYSHHLGLRKPNEAIFELLLGQHQLEAGETLFIDDSQQHVDGAIRAGIQAKLLRAGTEVESAIREWL
jgi:FMN phosphatase YigB (HAD superfamily)